MDEKITIIDASNTAFSGIVEFLLPILLFESFITTTRSRTIRPWVSDDSLVLTSKAIPTGICFYPHYWIEDLSHLRMPTSVTIYRNSTGSEETTPNTLNLGLSAYNIVERLSVSAVISFYQRQKDNIRSTFGDVKNWPETLKFLRHLRNGFAHNNKFDIRSASDHATWRDIRIDASVHEKEVLKGILEIGDVPLLLAEAGALIR